MKDVKGMVTEVIFHREIPHLEADRTLTRGIVVEVTKMEP